MLARLEGTDDGAENGRWEVDLWWQGSALDERKKETTTKGRGGTGQGKEEVGEEEMICGRSPLLLLKKKPTKNVNQKRKEKKMSIKPLCEKFSPPQNFLFT